MAASVSTEAASAVWTMNRLTALGSSGGMGVGVARDGMHPMINDKVMNQINSFILVVAIFCFMLHRCQPQFPSPDPLFHSASGP